MDLLDYARKLLNRSSATREIRLSICKACEKLSADYVVHSDVLRDAKVVLDENEHICLPCLEVALKRNMTIDDFSFFSPQNDALFFGYRLGCEEAVDQARQGVKRLRTRVPDVRARTSTKDEGS